MMAPPAPSAVKTITDRLAETRWDIPAFARLLGIEGHPGQEELWDAMIQRDETRWRALWLTICDSAGNRAGKTLALAIGILHHCLHKIGMRPPGLNAPDREYEAWLDESYDWYHFGIQQEIGELVFNEIVSILEGRHEAQKRKGCPLTDELGPIAAYDLKERGEYRWVRIDPMLGGAQIHFRTTNEKALGSLGKDMNGISFDECGFESNLTFIVNEVLHFRRLSTSGPLILISTPSEGFTQFSDEWRRGDPLSPEREPYRLSLRMSTRDNIGYGIDIATFEKLIAGYPKELIPQNVDGFFIEGRKAFFNHEAVDKMFRDELPESEPPQKGSWYCAGVDPASRHDGTWSITLKVSEGKGQGVHVARREGKQVTGKVIEMICEPHKLYNGTGVSCATGMDTSGFGGHVFKDLLDAALGNEYPAVRQVEFGGTRIKKLRMLLDLKSMIEEGKLAFPRTGPWLTLRRQLFGYRLEDKGLDTDAVMALAVAVKMLRMNLTDNATPAPFAFFGSPSAGNTGYTGPRAGRSSLFARRSTTVARMSNP